MSKRICASYRKSNPYLYNDRIHEFVPVAFEFCTLSVCLIEEQIGSWLGCSRWRLVCPLANILAASFQQANISPSAIQPSQPATYTNLPKAVLLVGDNTCFVFGENARLQRPQPGRL